MDLEKTGELLSRLRKECGMTQKQVAEKLQISDRTVSKWERGKSMPDASIMLELCEILGITVNELLSGERIKMEDYKKKAEENLIELQAKKEKAQKDFDFLSKILIPVFLLFFVLNMVLNFYFPEKNYNGLLGFASFIIAVMFFVAWFFKYYEIKLK